MALLGQKDEPVDGVEDYCAFLGRALANRGVDLQQVRVPWVKQGWPGALRALWRDAAGWRGRWVLLQYTALSWSRRGFPFGVLAVLAVLRRRGVSCAVVFHEWSRHRKPSGWFDRTRSACQDWAVCRLYRGAETAIFVDPLKNVPWLPNDDAKSVFIPIGANIPERPPQTAELPERNGATRKVAVFCVDGMPHLEEELCDISNAARVAAKNGAKLRITFLGRGTREARDEIARAFRDIPVEVSNLGLIDADYVSDVLAQSDALLCVRGRIFPSRGSAIAGIACGLPILGYAGAAEGTPLEEAGLVLVPYRDGEALGAALTRVLADPKLAGELRNKSVQAQQKYFSWDLIARRFVESLGLARSDKGKGLGRNETVTSPALKRTMRVLIYGEHFLPLVGGVQSLMNLLARGFAKLPAESVQNGAGGVEVTVATRTPANGMADASLPYGVVRQPGFWRLVRLIRESDVVHIAGPCLLPMAIAWLIGKPTVVEHHGYQASCPNGLLFQQPAQTVCPGHFMGKRYGECLRCCSSTRGLRGRFRDVLLTFPRRWLCTKVAVNITVTNHVATRVRLPRSQTVYHGIEILNVAGTNHSLSPARPLQIASVGRLVAEKGLPVFLQAVKYLMDQGANLRVTFIGDGPQRKELETLTESLGLSGAVTFTGDLRGPDLDRAVSSIDVVVMPSLCEETAGLSAIEQMMRGRVVVAADIGGLSEVVGDAGLKFPSGDAKALASCIERIIAEPELLPSLGHAAHARAIRLFTTDSMIQGHVALYQRAVLRCGR